MKTKFYIHSVNLISGNQFSNDLSFDTREEAQGVCDIVNTVPVNKVIMTHVEES